MTANSTSKVTNKILINYQQAIEIISTVSSRHTTNNTINQLLINSSGDTLAECINSPINVPSFNNSAMDGFAVYSEFVNQQVKDNGAVKLLVTGSIQAGDEATTVAEVKNDNAWDIMTGAPVPNSFDAVIQIENVEINNEGNNKYITIKENVIKGRNIRKLGTDYKTNQVVANKHTQIQAQHIMALATVGVNMINVLPTIKVAILSTGNELFNIKDDKLHSGTIFNSNQPYLRAYCQKINLDPVFIGSCKDNKQAFNDLIDYALLKKVKIIFSTGAVSMGKFDFIPEVLIKRGAKIHFHKAKIRPGKPILFAELPDGTVYFGLPGNPIAAASGMRFFATPFINNMLGLAEEKFIKAKLQNTIKSKKGFRTFAKAYASIDIHGQLCVDMLLDQGSYQSRSFAQSNCWLIIPEESENIMADELVEIAPMIPNQMIF